jgi:hypothetical protein
MDSITLPLWQLIGAVALPSAILIMLVTRLLGQKRRRRTSLVSIRNNFQPAAAGTYDQRIYQEMVSQQIDAVFNALNAVIEAERIKLKALVLHQKDNPSASMEFSSPQDNALAEQADQAVQDLSRRYLADRAEETGPAPDADGTQRISRNEAALAKMLRGKTEKNYQRVEAMA